MKNLRKLRKLTAFQKLELLNTKSIAGADLN